MPQGGAGAGALRPRRAGRGVPAGVSEGVVHEDLTSVTVTSHPTQCRSPARCPQAPRGPAALRRVVHEDLSVLGNEFLGHQNNVAPDVHEGCVAVNS